MNRISSIVVRGLLVAAILFGEPVSPLKQPLPALQFAARYPATPRGPWGAVRSMYAGLGLPFQRV